MTPTERVTGKRPVRVVRTDPHVAVLVVFHQNVQHTLSCIGSAVGLDYPSFEVVAVDDGSTDGCAAAVEATYPNVRILRGDGNLWCNGGFNFGLRDCMQRGLEYVLLLNNDNVIAPEALRFLMESERQQHPCVVGSVVVSSASADIVSYVGKRMNWSTGQPTSLYEGAPLSSLPAGPLLVDSMGFQGVLIPRQVFDAVGLIDDLTFKHYFGDTDFYLRAAESGFPIMIDCRSVISEDQSTKGRDGPEPTLRGFVANLFSIRSVAHVPSRYRFYRRHVPDRWWVTFGRYYGSLFRAQVATMLKYRLRQVQGENGRIEKFLRRIVGKAS
ncbi:MAG: glycosyltransferase family 2 protein [Gaiellaceae bacterium]|jgi:GT2 family glycosyltransferase